MPFVKLTGVVSTMISFLFNAQCFLRMIWIMRFVWLVPCFWHGKKPLNFNVCTVYSACCSVNHGQKCGLHWQQEGIRQPHTARPAMLRAEAYDLGDPQLNRCWNLGWEATWYHNSKKGTKNIKCRHKVDLSVKGIQDEPWLAAVKGSMIFSVFKLVTKKALGVEGAAEIPIGDRGQEPFHGNIINYSHYPLVNVYITMENCQL